MNFEKLLKFGMTGSLIVYCRFLSFWLSITTKEARLKVFNIIFAVSTGFVCLATIGFCNFVIVLDGWIYNSRRHKKLIFSRLPSLCLGG